MHEMKEVVQELRAFLAKLEERPDIKVRERKIGPGASAELVERIRALDPELAELYAQANGIWIEWEFVDAPGGGCILVDEVEEPPLFTTDEEYYMGFGEGIRACLVDENATETGGWLLRDPSGKTRIVYATLGGGEQGIELCDTIAEYFRLVMRYGAVRHWPRVHVEGFGYDEVSAAVRRFQAPPAGVS